MSYKKLAVIVTAIALISRLVSSLIKNDSLEIGQAILIILIYICGYLQGRWFAE